MFGTDADSALAMSHHPGVMGRWSLFEMGNARMRSVLPDGLADRVVFVAASTVGCSWCVDFGASLWERRGLDPAALRDAVAWRTAESLTGDERAAFAFSESMCEQPVATGDAMVADLRRRFGDDGVVEIAYWTALENMRSRFNASLGLSSQGFSSGAACELPAHG